MFFARNCRSGSDAIADIELHCHSLPMKPFGRRLRLALGTAALAILCVDAWWLSTRDLHETQQFSLFLTPAAVEYGDERQFPRYDPRSGQWSLQGHRLNTLLPYLWDSDGGPHRIGKFIIVSVAKPASADTVRETLSALIKKGICQVGVMDLDYHSGGDRDVLVTSIDWVLDDRGVRTRCKSSVGWTLSGEPA
jgi:hypothetical protein